MKRRSVCGALLAALATMAVAGAARAHNPIFAPGPHVVHKGGLEMTIGYERERARGSGPDRSADMAELELEYGLTADWSAEAVLPVAWKRTEDRRSGGIGDAVLLSRYRFFRRDTPGRQRSAALLAAVKLPTGDGEASPALGSGSVDMLGGLLYGLESRRWYYNAAARYRLNTVGEGGRRRGDRQFLDLVGGVRPVLGAYRAPDTVLFLELNWENAFADEINGGRVANTGGWALFLSPGVFWTYRNVALRAGTQLRIVDDLQAAESEPDYRVKNELRYTF